MATLIACPKCRTVVPPNQPACLRCGHAVDAPVRVCVACRHRNDQGSRFCGSCGHSLAELAPAGPAGPVEQAETTGVLLGTGPSPKPFLAMLAILVALGLVVVGLKVVDHRFFSPGRTVSSYFAALAARDAAAARDLLVPGSSGDARAPLLQRAALKSGGYTPPSGARVEQIDTDGDRATVRVSFLLGGQRQTLDLPLQRDERTTAGLFHRWRVDGGVYELDVAADGVSAVEVAGAPIELSEDAQSASLAAFPGAYRVSLPDQPLWTAAPVVAFAGGGSAPAVLEPTVKDSAKSAVDDQIRAYLDDCAESTVLSPPNCPFSAYTYDQVRNVHWKITKYPEYELTRDYDGQLEVSGTTEGEAEATGTGVPSYGGGNYPYSDDNQFSVSGTVTLAGNEVTFQARVP
jgi:hypothetical protein